MADRALGNNPFSLQAEEDQPLFVPSTSVANSTPVSIPKEEGTIPRLQSFRTTLNRPFENPEPVSQNPAIQRGFEMGQSVGFDSGGLVGATKKITPQVQKLIPQILEKAKHRQTYAGGGSANISHYEHINLPDELRGEVDQYFERLYESPIKTSGGGVHFNPGDAPNYFAHTRVDDMADMKTRRVIELQSDLFQKERLEGERKLLSVGSLGEGSPKKYLPSRDAELSKLEPFRNDWAPRIIREEVKQAAKDGKTKLQFPVGETAMKIEGLGDAGVSPRWVNTATKTNLQPDELKVGLHIFDRADQDWIITDVLGDGKFKAVQSNVSLNVANDKKLYDLAVHRGLIGEFNDFDLHSVPKEKLYNDSAILKALNESTFTETFDISGKVDQSNPIYRFYEKEVGRYLSNKYGAKRITDPQGVEWWEVNIDPKLKDMPVEAYATAPLLLGISEARKKSENERVNQSTPLFIPKN